jgi:sugar transferase EpsL
MRLGGIGPELPGNAERTDDDHKAVHGRSMSRLMHPRPKARNPWAKRVIDVIASSAALVVFSPLLAWLAWRVHQEIGSPVLFRQLRPGLNGRPFIMAKFRTMKNALDAAGHLLPDADRLTPFGRWLRSTSLDELPELWNVLRGDMSLVGPRPLLMQYLDRYTPEQARRHEVRPGITGWAQINGRNAISWEEKLVLDVWYVDNHNLWLDVRILTATVSRVVRRDGISATGEATMPEFRGSTRESEAGS